MTFRLVKAKFIQNTQRDVGWASSDARCNDVKFYESKTILLELSM